MLRDRGRAIAAFLLAAVCVSSLASLGASQAPTNRENFNPAFPLAGSCWNDDQCAAGRRCNQDGICVSATSNALPAHAPWSSQQTATTVGVLAGAGCCLIMWIMGAATLDWPAGCNVGQMSEGHAKHLFQWFCCGVCWCIPVALLIALPLGKTQLPTYPDGPGTGGNCTDVGALACDPYYCDVVEQKCYEACGGDGECRGGSVCHEGACVIDQTAKRIPGAREKVVNNWVAWVSASSLAILCFLICAPLAACCINEYDFDNPVGKCGAIGFVVVCVIVGGAALGLPLGLATTDIAALFPANGTECASSASCAPYFCNYAVGQCNSRCSTSVECQEGYNCVGGYCLSDVAGDSGSVRTKLLSPGVVVAITLSGACCCALCCGVPAGLDDEEELGLGVGVCVCVVVGLALGLGLGLPTKSVELSPPGNNGTACADIEATICEPYYCDASAHICLDRCSDNSECRGGTTCSFDFQCVVDLSATVKTFRFEGWYAAVLGYGIPLLLFTAIYVGGIKALGINPQHPYTDRVLPKFVGVNVVAFLTCFVVMAILWPILSRSTDVTIPVGVVPDNATTCTGISDSRCFPYYCNMVESQCLGSCAADEECADGYFCSDDLACIEGNYQLPVARYAKRGVWCGVAALLGTMAYGCLMAYGSGLSTERNFNWGVTDERLGLVFWVALCCGGGLALFAILPMTNAWRLHDQFTDANGPSCAFVNDVSCGAYFCDTEGGACYTSCADDYGCKRGFLCDAGACTASGDAARFKTIGIILGGVATAVVLLLAIGPYYCRGHRRRERVRLAERRARAEAELEAFNEQQARIQKVHLSIDPAAPMAYDYSMVSPLAAPGAQAFDFPQPIFENVGGGGAGGGGGGPDVRDIDPDALPDGPLPNLTLPGTVPPTGSDDTDGTPLPEPVDVAIPPPRSPSDSRPGTSELCSICFAAPSVVRFAGRNCAHGFCDECAKFSLEAIMNADQFPARCPGCLAENPDNDAPEAERSFIPSEIVERLVQRAILTVEFGARFIHLQILKAFAPDEIITCPTCELLSIKPNWGRKGGKDKYVVTCENPECRTEYCGNCLVFQFKHRGLTCKQYADRLQHGDDEATTMLLKSVARPCPNCGVPTIHYRGHACHHIKPGSGCPQCGFHWCFECGMRHPCARQGHTLFCDDNCTCPTCPDCYPGHPCENCDGGGGCPACSGREVINEQWHERQAALRAPTPEPQVAIGFPDAVDVEPIHQFAIGDIDPAFLLAFANGGGMDALDGPELVQLQQQLEAAIAAGLVDPNAVDGGGGGGAGEPRGSRSVSTSSSVASCSSDGDGDVDGLVAQLMAMGFDADASMAALAAHNNNVEHAINALL